jgi:beta-galactosidase
MWNFHEPLEGKFNFTGDHDLNAFLSIVKSLDMYAIVRVGPIIVPNGIWVVIRYG